MRAVFRHELSAGFTGMSGYVFAAFLLLFGGIYTTAYNLQGGVSNFEYVLSGMSFVFLIIVPIITMRSVAEERRQKTDLLLYSLPLSMSEVILGKYFALLFTLLCPLLALGLYPLILSAYGAVYLPAAYGAIVGFFFLGAALIAAGLFISCATESQAVAAGLCFALLLVNYFLAGLASFVSQTALASFTAFFILILVFALIFRLMTGNGLVASLIVIFMETGLFLLFLFSEESFEGAFPALMEALSLFARFEPFINAIFDLRAIVFYISVAAVFIFLSVQAMEKRRWS